MRGAPPRPPAVPPPGVLSEAIPGLTLPCDGGEALGLLEAGVRRLGGLQARLAAGLAVALAAAVASPLLGGLGVLVALLALAGSLALGVGVMQAFAWQVYLGRLRSHVAGGGGLEGICGRPLWPPPG